MNSSDRVFIGETINCDICGRTAYVDGKMNTTGQWAYMCKRCFHVYGVGLGLGKGQILDPQEKRAT